MHSSLYTSKNQSAGTQRKQPKYSFKNETFQHAVKMSTQGTEKLYIQSGQTFANGRDEESFSRSNGITKGSNKAVDENADCRKKHLSSRILK